MWISTHKVLPYADEGEATVLGHLRRALEFNLERTGKHGLPCGLLADWNDCLRLGYYGESLFVAFQVCLGLAVYAGIAERLGQPAEAAWAWTERAKDAGKDPGLQLGRGLVHLGDHRRRHGLWNARIRGRPGLPEHPALGGASAKPPPRNRRSAACRPSTSGWPPPTG